MHVVDTDVLSGPALATARRAARLQQRGREGRACELVGESEVGILGTLQRILGNMREGRASRRARRLLVGATLACAVVLCTLAIIDGGARGDAVFVAFSPSSFSFGRRALLQASSSSQSSGNNNSNSTTTTTNNAGGGAQQSTGEEDKPDSWGGAQTILTLCASGGSFFLSGFNKHKLDKVEVGIRGTNETFLPLCVK